jgi:YVTN family beta-propeller protein
VRPAPSAQRQNPQYLAINPDSTWAYVANEDSDTVTPIDLRTNQPGTPIRLAAGSGPVAVAFTPDGTTAFAADYQDGTVTPIDVATRAVGSPIQVGVAPSALGITPDGKTLYVTNQGSGTVTPIDVASAFPGDEITVGRQPDAIAVTPDGNTAYVANFGDGTVTPIDLSGSAPAAGAAIPLRSNAGPTSIAISPDGKTAYVADFNIGALSEINTANNGLLRTVDVGGNPLGVAVTPDQGPTARFSVTPMPSGQLTTLDATQSLAVSTAITNYHFDFGDGSAPSDSAVPIVQHVYPMPGHYTATVTVTDAGGSSDSSVYTGQMTLSNGGPGATATAGVDIELPASGANPIVYVTGYGNSSVTPIATQPTIAVGAAVPVQANPAAIAITPDGRIAYTVNSGAGTVTPIELHGDNPQPQIHVGNEPVAIAISPNGASAYVANEGSADLSVITVATSAVSNIPLPSGSRPVAVAIDPAGAWAYVADEATGQILPVHLTDGQVGSGVSAGPGSNPVALGVSPDGSTLYAANAGNDTVVSFSIDANGLGALTHTASFDAGSKPAAIAIAPNGLGVFVALENSGGLKQLTADLATQTNIPLSENNKPDGLAITPNNHVLFVAESARTT